MTRTQNPRIPEGVGRVLSPLFGRNRTTRHVEYLDCDGPGLHLHPQTRKIVSIKLCKGGVGRDEVRGDVRFQSMLCADLSPLSWLAAFGGEHESA